MCKKIIILVGQSSSGKTTYVRDVILKPYSTLEFIESPFKMTVAKNIEFSMLLFGHYKGKKRCEGTDELSMAILPKLIEYITINKDKYDLILAEGDRINNKKFFETVQELNVPVDLYVMSCSIKESMERLKLEGSSIGETFVKTTKTKASNMRLLGKRLGFNVIDINTGTEEKNLFDF